VATDGRSLDELLARDTDQGAARGLKRSLAYGTLRWHFRLVAILRGLADVRRSSCRQGCVRCSRWASTSCCRRAAAHAAVAETVNAARELGFARTAGFVNAVLRRFQRERDVVLAAVDADLAVRSAHPGWLVEALRREYGDRVEAILEANNAHPPMWLRVNRRRWRVADAVAALEAGGWQVHPHALAPDALRIDPPADVRQLPGFDDGRISVQDAAAQLAVDLLEPRAGERILDACAAPGGKTCHVLERVTGPAT